MNNIIAITYTISRTISKKRSRACVATSAALFLVLLLSGCRYTATPVDLLQAPDIDKDMARLVSVVDKSLSKFGKLMLPLREEGEGAIRLLDVDGDGSQEAVVSLYNDSYSPQLLVFKEQHSVWREWLTIEQPLASKMEWLHIADMNNDGVMELMVGWAGSFDVPNMLEIYSFQNDGVRTVEGKTVLQPAQMFPYNYADVGVVDDNGTKLLAVIEEQGGNVGKADDANIVLNHYELNLYAWQSGMMLLQTSVSLNHEVNGYERLIIGRIAPEKYGIVLEAGAGTHSMLTTMYEWNNGALQHKYPQQGSFDDGLTVSAVRNQDINDDGIIELQRILEPLGNFGTPYSETIFINQWIQWDGYNRYYVIAEEYSSYKHGIVMSIPLEWRGYYTVRKPADEKYGLADFYFWNPNWVGEADELSLIVSLHAVPLLEWEAVEAGWRENSVQYRVLLRDSGNLYIAVYGDKDPDGLTADNLTKYSSMRQEDLLDGRINVRIDH